jgi:Cu(I)/Ag(I) efflux system membrane protein CusA/SilA
VSLNIANLPLDSFDFGQEPMTLLKVQASQTFPRGDTRKLKRRQLQEQGEQQPLMRKDRLANVDVTVSQLWLEAFRHRETIRLIKGDRAMATVGEELELPPGYSISWSGQYEYMLRAKEKLTYLVPFTLLIIALLLFLNFQRFAEIAVLLCTLPLALVGSVWLIYWQDYHFSIAVGVGFIALAGVAVETSVIMLVYLNQSWQQASDTRQGLTDDELKDSIVAGAGLRVRPVLMTACATIAGLIPILMGSGTGSEVMSRLATPMVGGMISAVLSTLLILPAVYYLWRR